MKKSLILVRGIPGSGKTTFAEMLAKSLHAQVFSADDYFLVDGQYKFNATKLGEAHTLCVQNTEDAMWGQEPIIFVANTFTTPREMKVYFDIAAKYGYDVFSIIIENRHGNANIHSVPGKTLTIMKDRFDIKL